MCVYIINKTLHGRLGIRDFSSCVGELNSLVRCSISEIFSVQHSKKSFVSPHGHETFSMYSFETSLNPPYLKIGIQVKNDRILHTFA